MMNRLDGIIAFVETLSRFFQRVSGIATIILVLVTVQQVAARYWFQSSSVAIQELQWHLFGIVFLLAGAASLASNEHVRVDIFYSRLTPSQQAWINCLGVFIFLLPCCWILIDYGWNDVIQTRSFDTPSFGEDWSTSKLVHDSMLTRIRDFLLSGEASPDQGGLPARWIIKAALPLGALLMLCQGLVVAAQSLRVILTRRSQ